MEDKKTVRPPKRITRMTRKKLQEKPIPIKGKNPTHRNDENHWGQSKPR
jgi:hypothetical protein